MSPLFFQRSEQKLTIKRVTKGPSLRHPFLPLTVSIYSLTHRMGIPLERAAAEAGFHDV